MKNNKFSSFLFLLLLIVAFTGKAQNKPPFDDQIEKIEAQKVAFITEQLQDRKSTRLNSSHSDRSRMPSSA